MENDSPPPAQGLPATPPKQYATNRQMGVATYPLPPSETLENRVVLGILRAIRNSQALGGQ